MLKKKLAVLGLSTALITGLGVAESQPASAHVNVCNPSVGLPVSDSGIVSAVGSWDCGPPPRHYEYLSFNVQVQRKVIRRLRPDAWVTIGERIIYSGNMRGSSFGGGYCQWGDHWWRAHVIADEVGSSGVRRHEASSPQTSGPC